MKQTYTDVIAKLDLINKLNPYQPTPIGTPPLNIAIETSDIDIACTAKDLNDFVSTVTSAYTNQTNFSSELFQSRGKSAASCFFTSGGWEIELFCQTIPIKEQWGVRHFKVEKRLLDLQPELANRVVQLKRSGLKTEPAFAKLLGLSGDPFEAVLDLEYLSNAELLGVIKQAKW